MRRVISRMTLEDFPKVLSPQTSIEVLFIAVLSQLSHADLVICIEPGYPYITVFSKFHVSRGQLQSCVLYTKCAIAENSY